MKRVISIFIVLLCCMFHSPQLDAKSKHVSWGYMAHYAVYSSDYMQKVARSYDVLCVTGVFLDEQGSVFQIGRKQYTVIEKYCRHTSASFVPLVAFDTVRSGEKVLSDQRLRMKAIEALASFVEKSNLLELHLDFEYLDASYTSGLVAFLVALRKRLPGLRLSMAIFPPYAFSKKYAAFHDLRKMGKFLDRLVVMCYDYHNSRTSPGPVTDLQWTERNIRQVLKTVPGEKVLLGVPAYGYIWSTKKKARVIAARAIHTRLKGKQLSRDRSGCLYGMFQENQITCTVYVADAFTRKKMQQLVTRYQLQGTALWRLGFEMQ